MNENILTVIITAITVLGGAGAWKFYEFIIRNKAVKNKEDLAEQNIYREDLKARVDKLESDKDACNNSLLAMSIELASIKVRIEFVEKENERLKYRQ
jgi:outer membrane murein-binding lipoprotein Lpp